MRRERRERVNEDLGMNRGERLKYVRYENNRREEGGKVEKGDKYNRR